MSTGAGNPHAAHFAARLKGLREAAGLTQRELAEKAGVAQRTVSSLEQALYEPVWSTALALAEALGVQVQAFVPVNELTAETCPAPPKRTRGRPPKTAGTADPGAAPKRRPPK
jgi:putative transcriptional regulator